MKLDECVIGMCVVQCIVVDYGVDFVCLKIFNFGGFFKVCWVWDFFVDNCILVVVEDIWGGEIVIVIFVYFVVFMFMEFLQNIMDLCNYNICLIGILSLCINNGKFFVFDILGFGVVFNFVFFGEFVVDYGVVI